MRRNSKIKNSFNDLIDKNKLFESVDTVSESDTLVENLIKDEGTFENTGFTPYTSSQGEGSNTSFENTGFTPYTSSQGVEENSSGNKSRFISIKGLYKKYNGDISKIQADLKGKIVLELDPDEMFIAVSVFSLETELGDYESTVKLVELIVSKEKSEGGSIKFSSTPTPAPESTSTPAPELTPTPAPESTSNSPLGTISIRELYKECDGHAVEVQRKLMGKTLKDLVIEEYNILINKGFSPDTKLGGYASTHRFIDILVESSSDSDGNPSPVPNPVSTFESKGNSSPVPNPVSTSESGGNDENSCISIQNIATSVNFDLKAIRNKLRGISLEELCDKECEIYFAHKDDKIVEVSGFDSSRISIVYDLSKLDSSSFNWLVALITSSGTSSEPDKMITTEKKFSKSTSSEMTKAGKSGGTLSSSANSEFEMSENSTFRKQSIVNQMQFTGDDENVVILTENEVHNNTQSFERTPLQSYTGTFNGQTFTYKKFDEEIEPNKKFVKGLDDNDTASNYVAFIDEITANIEKHFGDWKRVTSLMVFSDILVFNGVSYEANMPDEYKQSLPFDVVSNLGDGKFAWLFNFSVLKKMKNLSSLKFDSAEFVYSKVRKDLGIIFDFSPAMLFKVCKSLQCLQIGDTVITPQNMLEHDDMFKRAKRKEGLSNIYNKANDFVWSYFKESWHSIGDIYNKDDYTFFEKAWGMSWRLVRTGVVGTGSLALNIPKKTKKYGKGFINFVNSVKNNLH